MCCKLRTDEQTSVSLQKHLLRVFVSCISCVYLSICSYLCFCMCVCVSVSLSHTYTGSCPPVNPPIIAVNQTLQTHKQTQRLRSCSPLRTHNTRKHPNTLTEQAEGRHFDPLWDKSRDTLSGRRLSEPLNRPIVSLFSPRCRLNWPLQQWGGDLFLQPRAPANRHNVGAAERWRGSCLLHTDMMGLCLRAARLEANCGYRVNESVCVCVCVSVGNFA